MRMTLGCEKAGRAVSANVAVNTTALTANCLLVIWVLGRLCIKIVQKMWIKSTGIERGPFFHEKFQAVACALSFSVTNESAKNSSSGSPALMYAACAESTTIGAPHA